MRNASGHQCKEKMNGSEKKSEREHVRHQPRSQGSLLPVPTERERERDPGWVWSHGHRKKLIPREESFVSQYMNNIFLSGSFSPFIQ